MRLLTVENKSLDMSQIPLQVDDVYYGVLDYSDLHSVDYFFPPLIFLESFNSATVVLRIGVDTIHMPLDWKLLIGSPEMKNLEVIPLTHLNGRNFCAFVFNPLSSFYPDFEKVEILDIYQDVTWCFPRLKSNQLLCIPLEESEKPRCVYFVRDTPKKMPIIDYCSAW